MNDVKYNPFGYTESTYKPRTGKIQDSSKINKTRWFLIALLVVVLFAVSLLAINAIGVRKTYNEAVSSMEEFNDSSSSVHQALITTNAQSKYSDMGKDTEVEEAKKLFTSTSDMIRRLPDNPPSLSEKDTNSDAALKVAPYFAICDVVKMYPPESGGEVQVACADYESIAREMMQNIASSNHVTGGVMGAFALKTDHLPDVTQE